MKNYSNEEACKIVIHNIKLLRQQYEFSKEKMAKILAVSVETINEIENEKLPEELTIEALFRAQNFFHISIKVLIGEYLS